MSEQPNESTATEDGMVGRALNMQRRLAGKSQRSLAAAMNEKGHKWDASSVSRMESGERSLRFTEVIHLCQILGITPNTLIERDSAGLDHAEMVLDSAIASLESIRRGLRSRS